MQQKTGTRQIRRQTGIRSHVLGDGMSPPSRELGASRIVTALSLAVSNALTSNAGKASRLLGSSACSRGCSHGKGDCRQCGFGGRGRTTIPAAAACSFSAFSHSCLSPKRHAPADGQTVNLGIIFGLFSACTLRLGNGWYCGIGKSIRRVLCAFRMAIFSVSVIESYRTVHKLFRTNRLHISSDSDII